MTNFVAWYRRVSQERLGAAADLLDDLREVLPSLESLSMIRTGEDARALEAVFGGLTSVRGTDSGSCRTGSGR